MENRLLIITVYNKTKQVQELSFKFALLYNQRVVQRYATICNDYFNYCRNGFNAHVIFISPYMKPGFFVILRWESLETVQRRDPEAHRPGKVPIGAKLLWVNDYPEISELDAENDSEIWPHNLSSLQKADQIPGHFWPGMEYMIPMDHFSIEWLGCFYQPFCQELAW